MSTQLQFSEGNNSAPVILSLEFANAYFIAGTSRDSFVVATREGEEVMTASKCINGSTHFHAAHPKHSNTAEAFSRINLHFDTLAMKVRE